MPFCHKCNCMLPTDVTNEISPSKYLCVFCEENKTYHVFEIDGKMEEMPKDWFIQDYAKFLDSVKEKYEQKKLKDIIGN